MSDTARDQSLLLVALVALAVGFAVVLAVSTYQFRADYRELKTAVTTPFECEHDATGSTCHFEKEADK